MTLTADKNKIDAILGCNQKFGAFIQPSGDKNDGIRAALKYCGRDSIAFEGSYVTTFTAQSDDCCSYGCGIMFSSYLI